MNNYNMDKNFLKVTYHLGTKKMNAYLMMPSPTFHVLKKEIEMCLFEERKQPRSEIRCYWIDEDHDEIEIINQCDYEIFLAKRSTSQHLQVAPIDTAPEEPVAGENLAHKASETLTDSSLNQAKVPPANDCAVHDNVECDACLMAPIMGFRYKCIQCPNYDLCQNCESKHIHSEHMMVRMPNNNCPNIVDAYITGRTSGRKHGKRSKPSCPFKNATSIANDDDAEAPTTASENIEQSSPSSGKDRYHSRKHHRRHYRNNFFSHLYEMMNDLAEGGGAAAAAHAMGETTTTGKTTSSTTGPQTTTTANTSCNDAGVENEIIENPMAAAAAAQLAAQKAHEISVKAAEMVAKVAHETAAKVAHETAVQAVKTVSENMFASSAPSTSAGCAASDEKEKETTKERVNANTSPRDPQPNAVPVIPSPSLESLAQFLDPQYMKTGIQILNNFSDMFAKMLDPMENDDVAENQTCPNLRKNSTTSTKSSVASNLNSLGSDKKSDNEKFVEKELNQEQTKETHHPGSDVSSHVEIDDLGSDSENESVSESFIKLDAPEEGTPSSAKTATAASSAQTTPPRSLDKSNVMDFAQLSADLKAHIEQESAEESVKTVETTITETVDNANGTSAITSTTITSEPVVTTSSNSLNTTSTSSTTTSTTTTEPNKPQEKRAIPVYHANQRINNSVIAMMSMGFSNEGAWLTQLLESVNGNISEALDLMTVAQRSGSR